MSQSGEHALSLSNDEKKTNKRPSYSVMAEEEKKKTPGLSLMLRTSCSLGKGVSFSVDVARVWLEVKALFTKE